MSTKEHTPNELTMTNERDHICVLLPGGAFIGKTLKVAGKHGRLNEGVDYFFSPLFVEETLKLGTMVYSYIVLTEYHEEELTYTFTSVNARDTDLLDRACGIPYGSSNKDDWLNFAEKYNLKFKKPATTQTVLANFNEEMLNKLTRIAESMERPRLNAGDTSQKLRFAEQQLVKVLESHKALLKEVNEVRDIKVKAFVPNDKRVTLEPILQGEIFAPYQETVELMGLPDFEKFVLIKLTIMDLQPYTAEVLITKAGLSVSSTKLEAVEGLTESISLNENIVVVKNTLSSFFIYSTIVDKL